MPRVCPCPPRVPVRHPPQVSLTRTYEFRNSKRTYTGVPVMSANMDTTGTFEVAVALAAQGLFTCMHKFYTVDQVGRVCV